MKKGAWANIPPKSNRSDPICFSPFLYRARNQVERFSIGSNIVVGWRRATTSSPPTTLPLSNSHLFGYGWPRVMSPRPSSMHLSHMTATAFARVSCPRLRRLDRLLFMVDFQNRPAPAKVLRAGRNHSAAFPPTESLLRRP
jgi:hypothetical protein